MKTGNCEICGIWDTNLVDGACQECITKYTRNTAEAREVFATAFKKPETPIIKLKRIADLARVSMVLVKL